MEKKEREKKRLKKREEKQKKKEARKANASGDILRIHPQIRPKR